jgi:hypothetical protein
LSVSSLDMYVLTPVLEIKRRQITPDDNYFAFGWPPPDPGMFEKG